MGRPKATLEWHGSTLVRRAVGIVGRAVDGPVVVVRAAGQSLPPLPGTVELAQDGRDGRGPFEGLAAGLAAIGDRADVVYLTSVDAPFLHPAFVRRVLALLGPGDDIALPNVDGFTQPLAAAYRTTVATPLAELLEAGDSPGSRALQRRCRACELAPAQLLADDEVRTHDPALRSLLNLNEPSDYDTARRHPAPEVSVVVDGGTSQHCVVATLTAATTAVGFALAAVDATVAGHAASDPEEPLVAGDVVTLTTRSR
jgi:molybdopterin-guanine dinucleotide biosynthesis protein A